VIHSVGAEERPQSLETVSGHEEHGLSEISHAIELDESRISIHFAVHGDGLAKDIPTYSGALDHVRAVDIPAYDEAYEAPAFLATGAADRSVGRHFYSVE